MDKQRIVYWLTTGLLAFAMAAGGIMDVTLADNVVETLNHLGYPHYFGVMLGVAKVLGAATIVAPRLPRLKEWAYAGIAIDLIAAVVSHAAVGDSVADIAPAAGLLGIGAISYLLRPDSRTLA